MATTHSDDLTCNGSDSKIRKRQGGNFCGAIGCTNGSYKYSCKGKSFFTFPKDVERCLKWVQNSRRDDLKDLTAAEIARKGIKMCSDHFESNQFNVPAERKRLIWNAVPTIFHFPISPPCVASKKTAEPGTETTNQSCDVKIECQTLTRQRSLVNCVKMEALRKEYQVLCQKFERLKTLARINLDLLFLNINKEDNPEVRVEMNKVKKLVQALLDEEERSGNEFGVKDACNSKQSCFDSGLVSGCGRDRNKGVIPRRNSKIVEEIVWRYVGRNKGKKNYDDVVSSPWFESKMMGTSVGDDKIYERCPVLGIETQTCMEDARSEEDRNSGCHLPENDEDGCDDKDEDEIYINDDVLPGISQNKETTDVIEIKDQSEDESKATQTDDLWSLTSDDASVGSQSHLSKLDLLMEEDSPRITAKNVGSHKKCYNSRRPDGNSDIDMEVRYMKKMRTDIKIILEEFGIPCSMLDSDGRMTCPVCSKEYTRKIDFLFHLKFHEREKKGDMDQNEESKQEHLLCFICGKTLKNQSALYGHIQQHRTIEKREYFKCPICGKECLGKKNLQFHIRVHAAKNFVCDICGKAYKSKTVLDFHQTCVHTKTKQELCQVCGKRFSNKYNFARHMRIHHGDLPFSCSICGKLFSFSDNRNSHERRHFGKFPHHCSICNPMGVISPGRLCEHQRTVLFVSGTEDKGDNCGLAVVKKRRVLPGRPRKSTTLHMS